MVSVHAGSEYVHQPTLAIAQQYRALIDAGADLVIGHHPHVIQGVERYRDGVIAYSLGNFSFSTYSVRHRAQGVRMYSLVVRASVQQGHIQQLELVPLWVDNAAAWQLGDRVLDPRPAEPQLLGGRFARFVLDEVERFSAAVPGARATKLHRIGSRAFVDLGHGPPPAAAVRKMLAAQRRAYRAVLAGGAGPRPANPRERRDTHDGSPAALRTDYRE